jgi:hypothetical protein
MPGQEAVDAYEHTTEERFQYGCAHSAIFHVLALISASLAFLELIDLLSNVFGFFVGADPDIAQLATSLGYFLLLLFYSLTMSSAYPSFRISSTGLTVQVFIFWWVFIPWKDVQGIRSALWGTSRLAFVRRLTPIHRIYGWIFALTPRPAFIITRRINDYDRAVKLIQRNSQGSDPL